VNLVKQTKHQHPSGTSSHCSHTIVLSGFPASHKCG